MPVLRFLAPALLVLAAACGGDSVSVRGTLHPSLLAGADGEGWSVWAEEAEREAPVEDGAFELADLAPGPVHLQLRRGGTEAGRLTLPTFGAGTRVTLEGLRVDGGSRLAFPSRVELDGAPVVWVNGIRMAGGDAVPDSVDARGVVLALEPDAGVMLFRPDDARLPDLRVVAANAAGPLTMEDLAAGDSLRIGGYREGDHVVVSRMDPADSAGGDFGDASTDSLDFGDSLAAADSRVVEDPAPAAAPAPIPSVAAPTVRGPSVPSAVSRDPPGRGRDDRGRGRGQGKGRGNGGKNQD